jgi:regulator of sigma E protease
MSYLAPLLVFGIVIFVHELGHFLAAKALGVYAPRFSIGFGPSLLKFRRGETEYVLAALPLGGYVRMASRLDEETAFLEGGSEEKADPAKVWDDPNAMMPFGPKPVPENRWFESKSLPARLVIRLAGVTMNGILAFVVNTAVISTTGTAVLPTTVVGDVAPLAGAPELSRMARGDTLRSVDGYAVANWNDFQKRMMQAAATVVIVTNRDTVRVQLTDSTRSPDVFGSITPFLPPVIDAVVPGKPAAVAGFQSRDSIVSIAGEPVTTWTDLTRIVGGSPGKPLVFQVVRAGQPQELTVTPFDTTEADPVTGKVRPVGKIGASRVNLVVRESVGFGEALAGGVSQTYFQAESVIRTVGDLFTGRRSVKELGGPIAITRVSVSEARNGLVALFELIAMLSINIAILNLLPIPILDGGQVILNIIETAKGSPFTLRSREMILKFGLVAIGLLFAVVMYNDTKGGFLWLWQQVVGLF